MRKIRIAFVASTFEVGGAERVIADLVGRLDGARFEYRFSFLKSTGRIGEEIRRRAPQRTEVIGASGLNPEALIHLIRSFRAFRPDVLFLVDHHDAIAWGSLAGRTAGVPVRVFASHATGRMNGRKSFSTLDRVMMSSDATVIAVSRMHAAYLAQEEGISPTQLAVVENGIDIDRYARVDDARVASARAALGLAPEAQVVSMIAALRPEKAHEALLEAALALRGERPSLRYLIIGEGARRGALERAARNLGVEDVVTFLGRREDVPELLHLSHVLVLPSLAAVETLPLAVLEAMAAGVPVAASRVGSIPEIIEDGVSGRLIAPGDAVGLSQAIRYIIDNSQETEAMVARGREIVRSRFAVESMVSKYEFLFDHLCRTSCEIKD